MQCTSNVSNSRKHYPSANRTSLAQKSSGISNLGIGPKSLRTAKQNVSTIRFLTPTKSTEEFDFKHVSKPELEAVVKRVRRANQKKRAEEDWKCFLKLKQEQNSSDGNGSNLENKRLSDESVSCKDCGLIELSSYPHPSQQQFQGTHGAETVAESSVYPSANGSVTALNESHLYQLGAALTKRLQDLLATVNKMTGLLLNPCLRSQYEDEDVDRTIKRSQEFDAMFARNHLYEIQRLLKDTKQMIATRSMSTVDLENKISAALKSVTQALQVYTRHVSKGSRIKYQQVVPIFQSINTTLGHIEQLTGQRLFSMRQEIEVSCSYMRQVLLDMSVTETRSVSSVSRASVVRTQTRHKHKPSADLSMYNRRNRPDWRRKTASLARARFGPPGKQSIRVATSVRESIPENLANGSNDGIQNMEVTGYKLNEKSQMHSKDLSNSKDVPYRHATRAVPEERVTTMMEMIPRELLEDSDLCIDDSTFQALKLLNGPTSKVPLKKDYSGDVQDTNTIRGEVAAVQNKTARPLSARSSGNRTASLKTDGTQKFEIAPENTNKPEVQICSNKETSNVKLVYLIEMDSKLKQTVLKDEVKQTLLEEDNRRVITLDEKTKDEALQFHRKMLEYQQSNSIYKDNKALGIVDRLATNILSEMISDFQNKEMDQVVQLLYKLEFE